MYVTGLNLLRKCTKMKDYVKLTGLLVQRTKLLSMLRRCYDNNKRNELSRQLTIVGSMINKEKDTIQINECVCGTKKLLREQAENNRKNKLI